MEQDVGEVVFAGIHSEKLAIQHVRYPCQWMPVTRAPRGEGPGDISPIQAGFYMGIIRDVITIIVVDEARMAHLPIKGNCDQHQRQANISIRTCQLHVRHRLDECAGSRA